MSQKPLSPRVHVILGLLLLATLAMARAAETPGGDIQVTLAPDGEHCIVHTVTIACADLTSYLRDTLKLPRETTIHLQAAPAASFESVRKVMAIIEKSGFNHPVGYVAEPNS